MKRERTILNCTLLVRQYGYYLTSRVQFIPLQMLSFYFFTIAAN